MLIIPLPAFSDNYIWLLRHGNQAVVVDPGDARPVIDYVRQNNLTLAAVLVTHHHKDHTGGLQDLAEAFGPDIIGPENPAITAVGRRVREGDRVALPALATHFQVLEIPGHTRDHIAFYNESVVFCGDTLFAAGCGRVFEGDAAMMLASLDKLAALPEHTLAYCAHEYTLANLRFARAVEPDNAALLAREHSDRHLRERGLPTVPSSLALERATNPFLRCREPAVVAAARRLAGQDLPDPVGVFAALREAKNTF